MIFGDLGNDWLVGGTGQRHDVGRLGQRPAQRRRRPRRTQRRTLERRTPDTHPTYEDRAYGGAGLDVLIANTGGDRLIDWVGEFNCYLVPFAPFGIATVSRQMQPAAARVPLRALAQRTAPTRRARPTPAPTPARNGEPYGELGLVTPEGPRPVAGPDRRPDRPAGRQHPRRQARRAALGRLQRRHARSGFAADSGTWAVTGGALQVAAASLGQDAAAVFYVDDYLPIYFEVAGDDHRRRSRPAAGRPTRTSSSTTSAPTDFKFAGIDVSTNKLVIGHRDATGWIVDTQTPFQAQGRTRSTTCCVAVNGTTVDA